MLSQFKRALVLAPHTDDGEFGCGATISKLAELECEVYYVAFSACKKSLRPELPKDTLITEVKEATSILGIKPENLILKEYQVRTFNYHRQDILQDMIELRNEINPDLVFMPARNDIHQDHGTIAQEGLRAYKFSSILCYEIPWNNLSFTTSAFVSLERKHLDRKLEALRAYKSQAHRPYANEEFIRGFAKTRGVQISQEYAEAFEALRILF